MQGRQTSDDLLTRLTVEQANVRTLPERGT